MKMINLHEPYLTNKDIKNVYLSMKSGWVSSAGPMIKRFEDKISKYTRSQNVIACSTGSSALQIAIKVLDFEENQEIIVPSLTFIASVNSIIYNNLSPFFIDNDKYYTIDTNKIVYFLNNNTKKIKIKNRNYLVNKFTLKTIRAILIVHTFGNTVNIDPIYSLCKKNNIIIIEDGAESLGSKYTKGRFKNYHAGTIGSIGCLSFNGNKIITTGSGGAILTNNKYLAKKARYYINQAKDDSLFYMHNNVGYNYRMNNIQAALGCAQIENLDNILKLKMDITKQYKNKISSDQLSISTSPNFCKSNNWLNILEINIKYTKKKLKQLILELAQMGIQCRPLWYPNHKQIPFLKYKNDKITYLNKIYNNRLCLPSSPNLTKNKINYISKEIKSIFAKL